MTKKEALSLILRNYPGNRDNRITQLAEDALRDRQLEAASMRFEGWPFLRREALINFDGGYDEGKVTCTQDSDSVTLIDDGTWPSDVEGWILAPQVANTERYTVKTRVSDTVVTLDRPYLGDTGSYNYAVYDRRGYLPIDYYIGESIVAEAESSKLGTVSLGYARAGIAKSVALGSAKFIFFTETTDTAKQTTGTVTIAKNDATVTLDGATWPTWVKHHFFRFASEQVWYRVASRTSDTVVELDRNYGGYNGGAGVAYELDPPGSYQLEYEYPREDKFTIRLVYFMAPQELVNDNDILEGPDVYSRAICNLAASDVLSSLPLAQIEQFQPMIQSLMRRGSSSLEAALRGRPEPNQEAVCHDIRYKNTTNWG